MLPNYHRRNYTAASLIVLMTIVCITICLAQNAETTHDTIQDLVKAIVKGELGTVKKILEADGTIANKRNSEGATPLFLVAQVGNSEIFDYMITAGADVKIRNSSGSCILHALACWGGDCAGKLKILDAAIRMGVDMNSQADDGVTPLHVAAGFSPPEIVDAFVKNGAKVDIRDSLTDITLNKAGGETPLFWAVGEKGVGRLENVKVLLKHGADINAKNALGWTPLHCLGKYTEEKASQEAWGTAARNRDEELVKELLANGAEINAEDNDNDTPLHVAIANNRNEIAKILIGNGADKGKKDKDGKTPLDVAIMVNNLEMTRVLSSGEGE